MFTSNFQKNANHPKAISISAGIPKWYKGKIYNKLCPPWTIVKRYKEGLITDKEYEERYYKKVLNKLDPHEVYKELGPDSVLLCWCSPDHFCHRFIVSKWLEKVGYKIKEL